MSEATNNQEPYKLTAEQGRQLLVLMFSSREYRPGELAEVMGLSAEDVPLLSLAMLMGSGVEMSERQRESLVAFLSEDEANGRPRRLLEWMCSDECTGSWADVLKAVRPKTAVTEV